MTISRNFQKVLTSAATIAAVICVAGVSGCGGGGETFLVSGAVLASGDVGDPLAGATATCAGTDISAITGVDGLFELECPMPAVDADQDGPVPAVMIWFEHPDFAPVAKTFVPTAGETYTVVPVMLKSAVPADVAIPTGNTSVPVLLGPLTLSFERDTLLDEAGAAVVGTASFRAGGWDNSLPVEEDESTHEMVMDALYPPWARLQVDSSVQDPWMRPIAAGWFDASPATINPDVPVMLQLFSRFADDVAGRDVNGAGDASLYLLRPDMNVPDRLTGAALTAINQISTEAILDGMMAWMVPIDEYACVEVTVTRGEVPATGAQVTMFETFNGELELFSDELVGAADGKYCLKAVTGKQLHVQAWLKGTFGLASVSDDVLSGGKGKCGGGCTAVSLNFPCEINEECAAGNICAEGVCTVPEATL